MRVAICTPIRNGMVHHAFAASLSHTIAGLRDLEIIWVTCIGNSILPDARANCVANAMGIGAQKLVCIDDDMSWTPQDFRFLITHPVDACTGLYVIRNHDDNVPTVSAVRFFDRPNNDTNENGLIDIDSAGLGFMCIDRSVFERMAPHVPKLEDKHVSEAGKPYLRDWFPYGTVEKDGIHHRVGEDIAFCQSMNKLGMRLWLDPAIQLGHHEGARVYRPNVRLYDASSAPPPTALSAA